MDAGTLDQNRLRRLIDAGRSLVSELDLDVLLERLLAVAAEVTGARYAALGILDEDRRELERFLTRGIDPEHHRAIGDLPRGRGILGVLIDDPRPLRLPSVGRDPRSYGFPPAHPAMETFLGTPVLIRGEAWGNLYLTEKRGGEEFTAADEEAVVVLAEWAGIAIGNARLYRASETRRDELERAVRSLEATTAIARAVGGETDLDRVLELIVKRGRALVDATGVLIVLRDDAGLTVAATAGEMPRSLQGSRLADDVRAALRTLGLEGETALLVPLAFRGRSLGLLAAVGPSGFGDEDERLLGAFAASAATAVATARSVAEERLRHSLAAAEAERSRWARELHDETLQGLGGLRMLVSAARRAKDPGALDAVIEQIDGEIDNLRALIRELRPAALDELGAVPAIEELAARMAERHGIEVDTAVELHGRRPRELETALYRIIQEALGNAVRHGGARRVAIAAREEGDTVRVTVADDGGGFDPQAPSAGFGLVGMRERVELLGGEIAISSSPEGTRVTALLPLGRAG
jgi:two-component system, NarL family, sensor histidine kinase DevS